ncbi:MAG TPA: serine hydrolase [Acetobacteraceae bacterium]|jgi:CubicO group peptidase (beta-lactamase class C family)
MARPFLFLRDLATAALLLTLLASSACADVPPIPVDLALPPPRATANVVPPAQIDAAIARLDELAADMLHQTQIPGLAIAVVRGGQTVYAAGFGVRRVGSADAVDADTVFQLASLSKSVGATVVAHQVGLGLISWDTPIVKHLPWFALSDDWVTHHVTIADMYAHRSGLPDHAGDELEDLGYDRGQVLRRLRLAKLHSFRDDYAYTNFGVTAAAEAVAAAAHTDWATLSEQVLYQPLGMTVTSSRFADFVHRPNHAVGHVRVGNGYQAKYQREPDAQSPAGGVSSSARDMARWMALILQGGVYEGRRIVDADALLPAITAEIVSSHSAAADARAGFYGYGFGVGTLPSGRVALSHSGAFDMGAATNYLMIPSLGLGIVVLSNAAPIGAVEAVGMEFADLVQFGAITRDWPSAYGQLMAPLNAPTGSLVGKTPPEHPAPALPPQVYVGTYHNDYFGDAIVARGGDAITLAIGPTKTAHPLRHWDGNVFTYEPSGESANAASISKVTFAVSAAGRAASLAIEYYDASGWSRFAR